MRADVYKKILILPLVKMLLDILTIEAAFAFSFYVRFYSAFTKIVPVTKGIPPVINYIYFSIFLVVCFILILAIFQSYRPHLHFSYSQELIIIFKSCLLGILIAMSAAFLYRELTYSRLVFFLIFIFTTLFLLVQRYVFHQVKQYLSQRGYFKLNLLLAGSPQLMSEFYAQFNRAQIPYFNLLSYFARQQSDLPLPYGGKISEIPTAIEREKPDGIVLAFDQTDLTHVKEIMNITEGKNLDLFYYPEVLDLIRSNIQFVDVRGLFLLKLKSSPLAGWQGFLKRIFDIVFSVLALVALSPIMIIIAILVKLSSKGPVFYIQKRIGLDDTEFGIIKFRSMVADAESKTGPVWAKKDDKRVTAIGKVLRRTSLDELPQLYNVIKGDMSLVGPRPERPDFVREFQTFIPKYRERHRFRSGITGWAQVNGLRGQSSIEERTRYDIYYIENWSLILDIKILILTMIAIFRGENAY